MIVRLLSIALAAAALTLSAQAGAEARNYGVSGFDRIRVLGPYRVTVKTGVAPSAKARGPSAALADLAIKVEGRTLTVRTDRLSGSSMTGRDSAPVEITITTHDLNQANLSGAGVMTIDKVKGLEFTLFVEGSGLSEIQQVATDRMKVAIAGTGAVRLSGETKSLDATVRGVGGLDSLGLKARDLKLGLDGAATVRAFASNSAAISGGGPGTVTLIGNPSCTLRLSGAASVTGCK